VRWVWLAGFLAAGCGVATSPGATLPACSSAVSPNRLGAIHFLTRNLGLGLTLRASPNCGPMLAITHDGGRHWLTEGAALAGNAGVEQLTATSTNDAWAVVGNGRLMSTTDAGATWTAETPRGSVLALALSERALPQLIGLPYPQLFAREDRTTVIGDRGRLLILRHGGRSLTKRPEPTWMGRPCQPAGLAADGRNWWLICLGGAAAGSSTKALFRTTDGGRRWTVVSQVTSLTAPPRPGAITLQEPNAIAAGSRARLWLAAQNNLYESGDGGARWSRVPGPDPQGAPAAFDVLSPTDVWLLAAGQRLWRTTDGRHWKALGPVAVSP
jgi:photosystem II stability/assembly factor-like uncharacterized protein